jgi:Protein of unknown function (DUF3768)
MEREAVNRQRERECAALPRAEQIARLNDTLRTACEGGTVVIAQSVRGLVGFHAGALVTALTEYDGFDENNNPHGERDFGDLALFGEELLWKVDYYDRDSKFHSDDPADASVTHRVLTIMLAVDY